MITKRSIVLLVLAAVLLAAGLPAWAADTKVPKVKAELVADVNAAAPGREFRLGVRFEVENGWHIYWSNPGEAGLPTQVNFGDAPGLTFGDIQYPEPELFGVGTPISGYGYEDELLLLASAKLEGETPAESVRVTAKASWLVCKHICLPGNQDVALTLPVKSVVEPSKHAKLFDRTQALVPTPVDAVPGLDISHRFGVSAVTPDAEFKLLFVVKAPPGKKIAPRNKKIHPPFAPLKPVNYEVLGVVVDDPNPNPREQIAVQMTVLAYPELDKAEQIGGTFQLVVVDGTNRKNIAVDYVATLPFAAAGSPVEQIALPDITATAAAAPPPPPPPVSAASALTMLLFAFLGGIILNVMPCVLPVLSIKVLSIIKQSDMTRAEIRNHGLSYTVGILSSFLALAIFVAILKSGGESVGWGFQFQSPVFVAILAAVVFVFGLSLLDVFLINPPTSNAVNDAASKGGLRGSFFNGIFATVLATPCTAPFLGTAVGFAFTQPLWATFSIFLAVGLGLAFPFLLLAFVPAWTRFMPKPGNWMDTFKAIMAFLLMGTVIWLLDVLGKQVGAAGQTRMLIFLGLLAFASWLYGRFGNVMRSTPVRYAATAAAIVIAVVGGMVTLQFAPLAQAGQLAPVSEDGIAWQRWSEDSVAKLVGDGKTVFVDFTAAWCWTCKVNERAVIETDEVRERIAQHGIVPLKGDYTNRDAAITAFLKRHGKAGVPVYVIIGPNTGGKPVILPEVLTKDLLLLELDKAVKGS
jgi:thiol:disulfide interchange protein/DsbC/DsbD-like thiol-disulfide interchange protein